MSTGYDFTQKAPGFSAVRALVKVQAGRGKIRRNYISRTEDGPLLHRAAGHRQLQKMRLEAAAKAFFLIPDFRQPVPALPIIIAFVDGKNRCFMTVAFKGCKQGAVFFSIMRKADTTGIHGAGTAFVLLRAVNDA